MLPPYKSRNIFERFTNDIFRLSSSSSSPCESLRDPEREREMEVRGYAYLVAVMLLSLAAVTSTEQVSSTECESLGFTGLALCSDCHTFAEYVKDQGLISKFEV